MGGRKYSLRKIHQNIIEIKNGKGYNAKQVLFRKK